MWKIFCMLLMVACNAGATPVQWSVADGGNGHWYEFVKGSADNNLTWSAARQVALNSTFQGQQGYLATVTSAAEQAFFQTQGFGIAWIGGSDAQAEGTWRWMDGPEAGEIFWNKGTTVDYAAWTPGEPNGGKNENYLIYGWDKSGRWNDGSGVPNSWTINTYGHIGYIVEYNAPPEPVSEPSDIFLMGLGAVSLLVSAKGRRKQGATA